MYGPLFVAPCLAEQKTCCSQHININQVNALLLHLQVLPSFVIEKRPVPRKQKEDAMVTPTSAPPDEATRNEAHNEKMRKIKAARDKLMATKTEEKGLIVVHTGAGKGKSSSGFGMIMRCIAHQMPCAVVQFIKGTWRTGERDFLEQRFSEECRFVVSGEGFTWETQNRARDIAAAQAGWEQAKALIRTPEIQFVLLDEINIALRYDYLDIDEVVQFLLKEKPPGTHVVLTGRNAKEELIAAADLVTEMSLVKHPFRDGIKAQKGIEF